MSSSIKVFLPSNSSFDRYPDNSPSDFRINFDQPIQLQGNWKVGIQSLFYPSKIGNVNETASIKLVSVYETNTFVNDVYPVKFKVNAKDGSWSSGPYYPDSFEEDPKNIDGIIATVNSINKSFLDDGKVFQFRREGDQIVYCGYQEDTCIMITPAIGHCLKFMYTYTFTGRGDTNSYYGSYEKKLTREDYKMYVFDKNIVQKEKRLILKKPGESYSLADFNDTFIALWKKRVKRHYEECSVKFNSAGDKLILEYRLQNKGLSFSKDMINRFFLHSHVFNPGEYWPSRSFDSKDHDAELWYVDIYSSKLEKTSKTFLNTDNILIRPRTFPDVTNIIDHLNRIMTATVKKRVTKENFNKDDHLVAFSIERNCAKLRIGRNVILKMSDNLRRMLGFEYPYFTSGMFSGKNIPMTLRETQQRLRIASNFISSVSFGDSKQYSMQHFIHELKESQDLIVKKVFYPIAYYPVSTNCITSVHIQILDDEGNVIKINGGKTLLLVHFVKDK